MGINKFNDSHCPLCCKNSAKVGRKKLPHLTLTFFGKLQNVSFIKNVSKRQKRYGKYKSWFSPPRYKSSSLSFDLKSNGTREIHPLPRLFFSFSLPRCPLISTFSSSSSFRPVAAAAVVALCPLFCACQSCYFRFRRWIETPPPPPSSLSSSPLPQPMFSVCCTWLYLPT